MKLKKSYFCCFLVSFRDLKVMPDIFLLFCFSIPKESTFETEENICFFSSKVLIVLKILKF